MVTQTSYHIELRRWRTLRYLATVDNDISPDIETLQFKEFGWEGNAKTRYIRYKALSNGIAGGWLFTDEIRVK